MFFVRVLKSLVFSLVLSIRLIFTTTKGSVCDLRATIQLLVTLKFSSRDCHVCFLDTQSINRKSCRPYGYGMYNQGLKASYTFQRRIHYQLKRDAIWGRSQGAWTSCEIYRCTTNSSMWSQSAMGQLWINSNSKRQSDPLMKELMCQYKYEDPRRDKNSGLLRIVFEIDQGSTLSYLAACKAVKRARILQKRRWHCTIFWIWRRGYIGAWNAQSTVSKQSTNPQKVNKSVTSDIAVDQFDSLLPHLEAPNLHLRHLRYHLASENSQSHLFLRQSTGGSELDASRRSWTARENGKKLPLRDKKGTGTRKFTSKNCTISWSLV